MTMVSPTPLSLFCVILLCLPLAFLFNHTPTAPSAAVDDVPVAAEIEQGGRGALILEVSGNFTERNEVVGLSPNGNFTTSEEPIGDEVHHQQVQESPPSPPPIQVDCADDYARLSSAGMVDSRPKKPFKVAFMFLATTSLPLSPLWEAFFRRAPSKLYNIYVHADPVLVNGSSFTGVFANKLMIDSKSTRRYSPTLISAARRLLAHALLHDASNSHLALISSSCIPLHSFKFTYKTLTSSRKSFVEILRSEPQAWSRWSACGDTAMLPDVPFESARMGSQFWVLTRRHARTVVRDRRIWTKFKQECTRWWDCYPEEIYFPTLLSLRDEKGCVPATLTHVDWNGSHDGHPKSYGAENVGPELISKLRRKRPRYGDEEIENGKDMGRARVLRQHPFLFARKFDPDALGPLMRIAAGVILKD